MQLGLEVGVPQYKLQEIQCDFPTVEGRKIKMLSTWLDLKQPTWTEVVGALVRIEERRVAQRIADKHGMFRFCMQAAIACSQASIPLIISL